MTSKKAPARKSHPSGMSRREAVKLAATGAAFGSILAFAVPGREAGGAERMSIKVERMAFKLYRKEILLQTIALPDTVAEELMGGNRIALKFYRNNVWQERDIPFDWA